MQNKPKQTSIAPMLELDADQLALVAGGHKMRASKPRRKRGSGPGGHSN
jgi:hypothetical protein